MLYKMNLIKPGLVANILQTELDVIRMLILSISMFRSCFLSRHCRHLYCPLIGGFETRVVAVLPQILLK